MAKRKRKTHYAVLRGRKQGIFLTWDECKSHTEGYPSACFKGFHSLEEAEAFMREGTGPSLKTAAISQPWSSLSSLNPVVPPETPPSTPSLVPSSRVPSSAAISCSSAAKGMMSKMGYKEGEGLGKASQGIVSPIKASGSASVPGGGHGVGFGKETLNAMQEKAVELVKSGHNVFITGPAGTGKSVVLRHILTYLKEKFSADLSRFVAVAPTGPTAIALGGQTIHSFAGCGVPEFAYDFKKIWDKRDRWRKLDVMMVEEISMISGEFLDRLSKNVSEIRKNPKPFGGIQLVLCGDFHQLPPITKSTHKIRTIKAALKTKGISDIDLHLDRGFAFQAKVWKEAIIRTVQLDHVFRQHNQHFVSVLHEIRKGRVSDSSLAFLKQCDRPLPPNKNGIKPTILYARNRDVSSENLECLNKIDGETHFFDANDKVELEPDAAPGAMSILTADSFYQNCIASKRLALKVGAQVMLIKNERPVEKETATSRRLVNGSRGRVVGFFNVNDAIEFDGVIEWDRIDLDNEHVKGQEYPIVVFQNNKKKVIFPERFESRLLGLGTCIRMAIPLKLAYAVTMHKSQGLTLDCVKVDLKGVFTDAQAYVALSRATDENGLEVRNFDRNSVRAEKRALAFYANPNSDFPSWTEPWERIAETTEEENREPIPLPKGKPGCLKGLAFVFTGEPESYSRNDVEALVKNCGGFVRSAVSGKTNYLVVGSNLEDGREVQSGSKYKKAIGIIQGENKSNLEVLTSDGLFNLINMRRAKP